LGIINCQTILSLKLIKTEGIIGLNTLPDKLLFILIVTLGKEENAPQLPLRIQKLGKGTLSLINSVRGVIKNFKSLNLTDLVMNQVSGLHPFLEESDNEDACGDNPIDSKLLIYIISTL